MRVRNFWLVAKFDKGHIIKDQVSSVGTQCLALENCRSVVQPACRSLSPDLLDSIHSPCCCLRHLSKHQIWAYGSPNRALHGSQPLQDKVQPLNMAFEAPRIIPGLCGSLTPQLGHQETVLPFLLLCFSYCWIRAPGRKKGQMETRLCVHISAARQLGKWKPPFSSFRKAWDVNHFFHIPNINGADLSGLFIFEWRRKFSPHYIDFTGILIPSVSDLSL